MKPERGGDPTIMKGKVQPPLLGKTSLSGYTLFYRITGKMSWPPPIINRVECIFS